jgi:hypothetical protein
MLWDQAIDNSRKGLERPALCEGRVDGVKPQKLLAIETISSTGARQSSP